MRAHIKPSKPVSLIAMIFGIGMAAFGIFMIPEIGWLGVLWTGGVLIIIIMHAANVFSSKGISQEYIDIEKPEKAIYSEGDNNDFEQKLRKLESLKKDNLVTQEEYDKKRAEIMKHSW